MKRERQGARTLPERRPDLLTGEEFLALPRQKRGVAARERLKSAALSLFAEKGYEATSVDEIAGRANVAVGGFYVYFRSKRQLLVVLMDELLEALARLNLEIPPEKPVKSALRQLLKSAFARDLRFLGAYRAWQEASLKDADLARMQRQIRDWSTARVRVVLFTLRRLPGSRQGVDLEGLARTIDTLFWALIAQAVSEPDVNLAPWIASATHLIYHAMFEDAPRKGGDK